MGAVTKVPVLIYFNIRVFHQISTQMHKVVATPLSPPCISAMIHRRKIDYDEHARKVEQASLSLQLLEAWVVFYHCLALLYNVHTWKSVHLTMPLGRYRDF